MSRKLTADEFIARAKLIYGERFDYSQVKYSGTDTKVKIRCIEHDNWFEQSPTTHYKHIGCRSCTKDRMRSESSAIILKEVKEFTEKVGGECLSVFSNNFHDKLKFKCEYGHLFEKSWNDIKYSLRWCPVCSKSKNIGEELARQMLEHALEIKLPSKHIKEMQGLELDGYNEAEKIAFEYQGYQHYLEGSHFHKKELDFERQLERDRLKKKLCKDNGIRLIEVNTFGRLTRKGIPKYYADVLKVVSRQELEYSTVPFEADLHELFRNVESDTYFEAQRIVVENGGQIEDYIGVENKHIYTCNEGHKVKRVLSSIIKSNASCPICEDVQKFLRLSESVELRGGHLLEITWKGVLNSYKWRCEKGHINSSTANVLINYWCVQCQREDTIKRPSKESMNDLNADLKSGECYQIDIFEKYNMTYPVLSRFIKENNIKPNYKPQDRQAQDISTKSKGVILKLDPNDLSIIKEYPYLESIRKITEDKYSPENIRGQMRKGRKAHGFYWCYKDNYESFVAEFGKDGL